MGARLFDRGPGGAALTAAGDALLPRARAALAAVDEGRRAVAEVMGLSVGSVRVGAGATCARTTCHERWRSSARVIRASRSCYARRTGRAPRCARGGDLDLVILARVAARRGAPRRRASLARSALGPRAREVGRRRDRPGRRARRRPEDGVTSSRSRTARRRAPWSISYFPGVPIAMELGSIAAVKGNTRAGVGIALLSRRAVERDVAQASS